MLGAQHRTVALPKGSQVETLRRSDAKANRIMPDTIVTVINRGVATLVRKWDGMDFAILPYTHKGGTKAAPFLLAMPYAGALHFQHHCPVPGTRDAESPDFAAISFLGILDTDPPENCEPFTQAQCKKFGQAIEALQRPEGDDAKPVKMKGQSSRVGQGGRGNSVGRKPQFTKDVAREHLQPPGGVSDEIRGDEAEGAAAEAAGESGADGVAAEA